LQVDTGWVGWLTLTGQKRRFRAWIFTAVRSRYRFVYPTFEETTARAIEACEAAWTFFGGVFKVLIPDNTRAIIATPAPLTPRITPAFLEDAQACGFHIDPARVRHPRDKGRVERAVATVRDDCFAGELVTTLEDARAHAARWCRDEYGGRRHSRTQRFPRKHFETEEQPVLRPRPTRPVRHAAVGGAAGGARSASAGGPNAVLRAPAVRRAHPAGARRPAHGPLL